MVSCRKIWQQLPWGVCVLLAIWYYGIWTSTTDMRQVCNFRLQITQFDHGVSSLR
jgi:hypothetical protein